VSATEAQLLERGQDPRDMEPEEFRKYIRDEVKKWTAVAKTAGIRVN